MSESSSWSTLRKHLKHQLAGVDIQRLEDKYAVGVPDANICWNGWDAWLEGKQLQALPSRDKTKVRIELKQAQTDWLRNRRQAGGATYVWLRVNNVGWWLFDNSAIFQCLTNGISKEELLALPHHKTTAGLVNELKESLLCRAI